MSVKGVAGKKRAGGTAQREKTAEKRVKEAGVKRRESRRRGQRGRRESVRSVSRMRQSDGD